MSRGHSGGESDVEGNGVVEAGEKLLGIQVCRIRDHPPTVFVGSHIPCSQRSAKKMLGSNLFRVNDFFVIRLPFDVLAHRSLFMLGLIEGRVRKHRERQGRGNRAFILPVRSSTLPWFVWFFHYWMLHEKIPICVGGPSFSSSGPTATN